MSVEVFACALVTASAEATDRFPRSPEDHGADRRSVGIHLPATIETRGSTTAPRPRDGQISAPDRKPDRRVGYGDAWFSAASALPLERTPDSSATLGRTCGSGYAPASGSRCVDRARASNPSRTCGPLGIMCRASSRPVSQSPSDGNPQESALSRGVTAAGGPRGLLARTASPRAEDQPPTSRDRRHPVRGPERLAPRQRRGRSGCAPSLGRFARARAGRLDRPFPRAGRTAGNDGSGRLRSRRRHAGASGSNH